MNWFENVALQLKRNLRGLIKKEILSIPFSAEMAYEPHWPHGNP